MAKVIAVSNQKGGVGKTTTTVNLGIGLVKKGKSVLLLDSDPQGSMTISLGNPDADSMHNTISDLFVHTVNDVEWLVEDYILTHSEGVDYIPANIDLATTEVQLVGVTMRETILKRIIAKILEEKDYDYILIDCMPSLGVLTINSLACADRVLIPVQAHHLPVKGLQQLFKSIGQAKKILNPDLEIEGILMTMVNTRTNYSKEIIKMLEEAYGGHVCIFRQIIPSSIRAAEISAEGKSIYQHDPKGKVAAAYTALTEEVVGHEQC